jgi:hypothetical protein
MNTSQPEGNDSDVYGYLSSFLSDGFTVTKGSDSTYGNNYLNHSALYGGSVPYVAWNWKAGTSTSGTTSGSGTGQSYSASYNTSAGFSVIKFRGNGTAGHTIPHHLGSPPDFFVVKGLDDLNANDNAGNWQLFHRGIDETAPEDWYLNLNETGSRVDSNTRWNDTAPSDTLITLGADWEINQSSTDYVCYAWRSIEGYSKMGSYTGNGSTDGTFIYTGFRPAFVIFRKASSGEEWSMFDSGREESNSLNLRLRPHSTAGEGGGVVGDFTANGIKLRTTDGQQNGSGDKYIFIAFAESPFKHTNAR